MYLKNRNTRILAIALCLVFILCGFASAADNKEKKDGFTTYAIKLKGFSQKDLSVTHHTIKIDGKPLEFTATAGYLPMEDEKGELRAKIFFISYTKDGLEDKSKRPVTFAFNGGPGSASMWLHFGAMGPKRVKLTDKGELPNPPYNFVDNEYTWLAFTDLVFIDPVDCGFSRAADDKYLKDYLGVREDINSVGEFIRLYVSLNNRWKSPKFVAGESYGAIRAAGLAAYLQSHVGMHLNGIIMISQALNYQVFCFEDGNDLPYVLYLPTYTAAAHYHKKLSPELQKQDLVKLLKEVEDWSQNEYSVALMKGGTLTQEERERVAEKIAHYCGISRQFVLNSNLRVRSYRFGKELLKDEHRSLGYYDGRLTGIEPAPEEFMWPENDPTFFLSGPFMTAVQDYVRNSLKFVNDLPYHIFSEKAGEKWNYDIGEHMGYLDKSESLSNAMNRNKYLKLFVACGYYDLCTPYFSSVYTTNHLRIPPEIRKNARIEFYPGGHMMYTNIIALKKLRADMEKFYNWTDSPAEEKQKPQ